MMKGTTLLAIAAIAGLMLGAQDSKKAGQEEDGDAKAILGTWVAVEAERGGEAYEEPLDDTLTFRDDGTVVFRKDGRQQQGDPVTYALDPSKSPRRITLTFRGPQGEEASRTAIYKIEGDSATLMLPTEGAEIPSEFETEGTTTYVLVKLERQEESEGVN